MTKKESATVDPRLGRAGFRVGFFLILVSGGMLLMLRPGTPEFAISVVSAIVGFLFIGVVALVVRVLGR